jgi:hypothetical protein
MKVKELKDLLSQYDDEQFILIGDQERWWYDIVDVKVQRLYQGKVVEPGTEGYDKSGSAVCLIPFPI